MPYQKRTQTGVRTTLVNPYAYYPVFPIWLKQVMR